MSRCQRIKLKLIIIFNKIMRRIRKIIKKFNSISIPEYLLYNSNIKDCYLIFDWIEFRKGRVVHNKLLESRSDIPEELKYPGWQTRSDDDDKTPLMLWIQHRKNEPIPKELFYAGCQTDVTECNENPLMLWIEYRTDETIRDESLEPQSGIPEELKYPGWQTDKTYMGETPLMYWIMCRHNKPIRNLLLESRSDIRDERIEPQSGIPEELKYEDWQTDTNRYDETPLMLWIMFRDNEPIPGELKYEDWQTDTTDSGFTPLMLWIQNRRVESVPWELYYTGCNTSGNKLSDTPLMLWLKYKHNIPIPVELMPDKLFYGKWGNNAPERRAYNKRQIQF